MRADVYLRQQLGSARFSVFRAVYLVVGLAGVLGLARVVGKFAEFKGPAFPLAFARGLVCTSAEAAGTSLLAKPCAVRNHVKHKRQCSLSTK